MLHPHDTSLRAPLGDAADQLAQDCGEGMTGDGLEELDAERGAYPDHDVAAILADRSGTHRAVADTFALGSLVRSLCSQHLLAREDVSDCHDLLAARIAYAISGARPKVVVWIVDRAEDMAVTDHCGGL